MPYRASKPCRYKGCSKMQLDKGFCEEHAKMKNKEHVATPQTMKLYNSKAWKAMRKTHLRQHPYCKICETVHELEVDHIKDHKGDPVLFFNQNNLQTLCKVHHSQKTMREINER